MSNLIRFPCRKTATQVEPRVVLDCMKALEGLETALGRIRFLIVSFTDGPAKIFLLHQQALLEDSLCEARSRALSLQSDPPDRGQSPACERCGGDMGLLGTRSRIGARPMKSVFRCNPCQRINSRADEFHARSVDQNEYGARQ